MFTRIFAALVAADGVPDRLMINATHLRAHRIAASLAQKRVLLVYRLHQNGLNSKLHAVCSGQGQPVALLLAKGQMSDHKDTALLLPALPPARELLGDRGYDNNRFRATLIERSIVPCIHRHAHAGSRSPTTKPCIEKRHLIAIRYD